MTDNYLKDPRARTIEGWIAALQIFSKYVGGLQAYLPVCAEHDILFLPAFPPAIGRTGGDEYQFAPEHEEDAKTLRGLGFHWSSEGDCWAKFT